MIRFSNKSHLIVALGLVADMGLVSTETESSSVLAPILGDLARLGMLRGELKLSASGDASGVASLEFYAGDTLLASETYDGSSSTQFEKSIKVDLSSVSSTTPLTILVGCTSTGADLAVNAWLDVEHPIIVAA